MATETHPDHEGRGGWQRAFAPLGTVAAGFTTLCCLGMSAAVSLGTSVGATFLTRDSALRPLLAVTLGLTVAGSALTFRRRRGPAWPLALTVVASLAIYGALYSGNGAMSGMDDGMAGETPALAGDRSGGLGNNRLALVWAGAALLIGVQVWDLLRTRRVRCSPSVRAEVV